MATESKKPADGIKLDVPSAHQRYLESLLGDEAKDRKAPVYGGEPVNPKDNKPVTDEGYVGVDPIYQNHANDTEKPLAAEKGPDKLAEDAFVEAATGEPKEAGEQLQTLYGEKANDREEGVVIGGEPVHASVTPVAPVDNENAGRTTGATGAQSDK